MKKKNFYLPPQVEFMDEMSPEKLLCSSIADSADSTFEDFPLYEFDEE